MKSAEKAASMTETVLFAVVSRPFPDGSVLIYLPVQVILDSEKSA